MIQITTGQTIFRINGKPYQKGAYEVIITGNQVGISRQQTYDPIVHPAIYTDWRDNSGSPFATMDDLVNYIASVFFLDARLVFDAVATNYTDLIATTPTAPTGSLAYVYSTQGTAWLPGTMGGTFYPDGIYVFNGSAWVSSRNMLSGQFQTLIDQVASLQANKADLTDPRFPTTSQKAALTGTDGTPSNANRYVTNSDPRNTNARVPLAHTHVPSEVGLGNVPNIDATNPNNTVVDATHRYATDVEKASWNAKQNALGYTAENAANKGASNGYAPLVSGTVPSVYLPSYVDDVIEGTLGTFPAVGETGKIYVDTVTDKEYRWTGSAYREISPSPGNTDAVPEGPTNFYFTTARVLSTLLAGFSVATGTAVVATDSVLVAFGKLQRQINDVLAFLPTAGQKSALVGSSGTPGVANRYVTEAGLLAALSQSGAPVTRPLNTAFTPSATKYSNCYYTVKCTAGVSLSGSGSAIAILETSPDGIVWTEAARCGVTYTSSLIVGVAITSAVDNQIATFVPINYQVRIRTAVTGGGTVAFTSGRETVIG